MSDVAESLLNPDAWVPNWDAVPFEVACSRCGHDLRGLSDARCPACDLNFDWAQVVPIRELTCRKCGYHLYGLRQTRCPECGEGFNWEQALADYHRRKIPIFEYRWREEPVRSFVRTWWWALWPKKFWQRLDIHDPPRVWPLIVMFVGFVVTFYLGLAFLDGLDRWLWRIAWVQRYSIGPQPRLSDLPLEIFSAARDAQLWMMVLAAMCWAGLIFSALLIFQQSMRLCRVRTAHVLRIWSCSGLVALLPVVLVNYILSYACAFCGWNWRWVDELIPPIALATLAFVTWSVRCGYRYYLCMPHAAFVAVCAQLVALLAFVIIDITWGIMDSNYGGIFLPFLLRVLVWT